jgi:hypothetical protein
MRLLIIKIFFILLCLTLFSCKKKVDEDYRPEFIGYWYCVDDQMNLFTISIDNNSHAVYHEVHSDGGGGDIKGKARANDKKLKIGRFSGFDISDYPHKIDTASSRNVPTDNTGATTKKANWTMTLKGPMLYLGSGTYYKADY